MTSLVTQSARTFCVFKSSRIIAWIVNWHRHVTSCSSSMITCLFFMITQDRRCADGDALAVGRWPGLIIIFTVLCPFVETFQPTKQLCDLGQHLHTWPPANKLCFHKIHVSHLCPRQSSSFFPSTDVIVLPKGNPCYPLPPSTGWFFNYIRPITWTIFEWLGISFQSLRVSLFYKQPLYKFKWIIVENLGDDTLLFASMPMGTH